MKTLDTHRIGPATRGALLVVASFHLLTACSGDLEDQDVFQAQVREGVGAKGVSRAQTSSGPQPVAPPPPASTSGTTPPPAPTGTSPSPPAPTGTNPPAPTGLSAACADIEVRVFQTKCAGAACHGEPGFPAAFFSDLGSHENLAPAVRDVPAKSGCTSMKLVDSANPSNSALLKVIGTDHVPCTSTQMPSGQDPLTADEVACVTEWVNAVASGQL